jgi:hypothetical protein
MSSSWIRKATIVFLLALVAAAATIYATNHTQPAQARDVVSIEGLTGQALGEELGLQSVTWEEVKGQCEAFAEYDEHNGFCLDSVVTSKTEAALLGRQINGHLMSEVERHYIELQFQLTELIDSGKGTQEEIDQLSNEVWELQKSLN